MSFGPYLAEIQRNLKGGQATEPSYYPALKTLVESLKPAIIATVNPKKTELGAPDFSIKRKRRILEFPVGWMEAKEPGEDLDKIERTNQLKRYLRLPNLILTDFLEFRWYTDGERRLTARLGDIHTKKLSTAADGETSVRDLLVGFMQHQIPPVRGSRELAQRMADLAHFIRDAILVAFEKESDRGRLHRQLEAFQTTLIPDLKAEQFSDMYAQTIAYGLFAARCQSPNANGGFTRASAAELIPRTNPFLRKLFQEVAGVDLPEPIRPFVDDLVALLRGTEIGSILADFGKRIAKEDPVVHFYEDFLQEYDPKLRELRGVYYTPEPVVSYIVRSIDQILKTEFNKPMGLADKDVLILDPACGTGTFLYYVIRHIYQALLEKGQKGQWNSYVSQNLLKRVFGFELLMAPYAVSHLKLGLLLQELGYKFDADERLGIYLTNTLEEAVRKAQEVFAFADAITDEGLAAQKIKRDEKIMVVLGNPPYSGHSANRSWEMVIDAKTKKPRKVLTFIGRLLQDYYMVDGQPLGEKNPKWLQDDYVKFIRFGQWRIDKTGYGILGFITNHGYLDNPTFRGMRQQLMRDFTDIRLLDLHGNVKKKEKAPDGSKDENVFDIQQGVAIGLYVKKQGVSGPATVQHADLWGTRSGKYKTLFDSDVATTPWEQLKPQSPAYLLIAQDADLLAEYETGWKVTDIFPVNSVGIVTARDSLTIHWSPEEMWKTVQDFVGLPVEDARSKYHLGGDTYDWKVHLAQNDLRLPAPTRDRVVPILYRPFDERFTYYTGQSRGFICRPRADVMPNMLAGTNVALIGARSNKSPEPDHFFCSRRIVEAKCGESTTQSYTFPLYVYSPVAKARTLFGLDGELPQTDGPHNSRHPNLAPKFTAEAETRLGLRFVPEGTGDRERTFGPEDVFGYMYAVFYCPSYRQRYAKFLKTGFPYLPITLDTNLFTKLVTKGSELVSLHLLASPHLTQFITEYKHAGDHRIEVVRYVEPNPAAQIESGRVYINDTQFFEGVPKDVWEFQVGGYQVCEKWLKDRKGRTLTSDDIDHYQKIVVALHETIRLMREIDEIIPGWPLQ